MLNRKTILLLTAGVVVVVVLVVLWNRGPSEPEYGGKKLSEWVQKCPSYPHTVFFAPTGGSPSAFRRTVPRFPDEAEAAILQIGTNAVPFLLRWVRYEPSDWKDSAYRAINPIFRHLERSWNFTDNKEVRAEGACYALMKLDLGGGGEIDQLTTLLNDQRAYRGAKRAILLLTGAGNAGVSSVAAFLTNRQAKVELRQLAALEILSHATNAQLAVPALHQLLTDTNAILRARARFVLNGLETGLNHRYPPRRGE